MDTNIKEYVKLGLDQAIAELECNIFGFEDLVVSSNTNLYKPTHLKTRVNSYKTAVKKQKELIKSLKNLDSNNKLEMGRIVRLIFDLSYFVKEDIEQIYTDIDKGSIYKIPLENLQ